MAFYQLPKNQETTTQTTCSIMDETKNLNCVNIMDMLDETVTSLYENNKSLLMYVYLI